MAAAPALSAGAAPRVSVCIANYDGEALLPACLASVLAQDPAADIEILVHDDASRDGSLALLRERYPQARVIASARNVGFCVANNRMAEAARGDYLLLLNNDAALFPDAIGRLLREAARIGAPAILTLPQYDWETGALVDRGCLLDPFHVPVPNLDPARVDVAYVIGACLWIPRATWQALGGFPDWLESLAEDMALCRHACLRGVPVRALPDSGYRHRQGASFGGNRVADGRLRTSYRRRRLSERNRLAVLATATPTWLAWPWLALHVLALACEGLAVSLLRRSLRPWREIYGAALADAWRWRARLLRHRARLQAERTIPLRGYLATYSPWPRKLALLTRHGLPTLEG